MGQRPILKNGVVINVIEIDDDTQIVTKAQHKQMLAEEAVDYEVRLATWREAIRDVQQQAADVIDQLAMARMTLSAMKTQAAGEKNDAKAAQALRQILAAEEDVKQREKAVSQAQAVAIPPKPRPASSKRYFHSDDVEVGPAGGNIGDLWDGKTYTRPEKVAPSDEKAAVPAA